MNQIVQPSRATNNTEPRCRETISARLFIEADGYWLHRKAI